MKSLRNTSILFGVIFIISFGMNQAHATEYIDEERRFSINYPTGWEIENEFVSQDGIDYIVTFYDDMEGWTSMLDIRYFPNLSMVQSGTDQQWLNGLNIGLAQGCELFTFKEYGSLCSNHKLIDSRIVYIDGKKSYQLTYSWTETLEDSTQYENISISTSIPDGYGSWVIYSETESDRYNFYKQKILIAIDSFDILKSSIDNSQISQYQSEDKIIFEEDVFSFSDRSQIRSVSLGTPKEFTPDWYVNSKHEFAIKFPKSQINNWTLNESFSGYKIAEFSSKNTDAKIEFFVKNGNQFQLLEELDKEGMFKETRNMITESINRIDGFFHVDSLFVTKFSDGFVTSGSFFKIDENGNTEQYDITYLIYENGKIVEVLYSGDNFTSRDFNNYVMMFESTYIGNTSIIPRVNESKTDSKMYVNYDLNFSFMLPENWADSELNTEVDSKLSPLTLNLIGGFIPPNFQGFYPPQLVVMYADLEEPSNFESKNDEFILNEMIDGMKNMGEKTDVSFELINSELERLDGVVKVNVEWTYEMSLDGIPIEQKIQTYMWIFENGEAYYFMFMADPIDYDTYISDFRKSVNTVSFKPKPQIISETSTTKSTQTEGKDSSGGGGCLIATATYGSELAPQVQQLRELRDNSLLHTESGTSFMKSFNGFYYSFSPIIADYERENPVFKEMVKIGITPMIFSLSILNYVNMDSESEVLGYGISLIILNLGMYVGIPITIVFIFRKISS
jgi:hypothetical protein